MQASLDRITAAADRASVAEVIFGGDNDFHSLPADERQVVMQAAVLRYQALPFRDTAGPAEIRFVVCCFAFEHPESIQERLRSFTALHPTWDTQIFRQAVNDALALVKKD